MKHLELFRVAAMPLQEVGFPYDVTADGQRFLLVQPSAEASNSGPTPFTLITNWQAGLKK